MSNRFIIILGMAHSGTTIFTKILSQCPKIRLFRNGTESHLLENDFLLKSDPNVKTLLNYPEPYILLKRPWMEERWGFYQHHMPEAHFYIMLKTFEKQVKSWSKPSSLVEHELRTDSLFQRARYEKCLREAMDFPLPKKIIHYDEFVDNPKAIYNQISKDLNLDYDFDVKEVKPG